MMKSKAKECKLLMIIEVECGIKKTKQMFQRIFLITKII